MPALTSIALGLGGLGAIGGAISGANGSTQTTTRNVPPPTQQEIDLQNNSMANYLQQLALSNQQQSDIQGGAGVQDASRSALQNIIGGQSFNLNPQQQEQINSIRQAAVQAGTQNVQDFVNQNLSSIGNNAGVRGLRGQALSELQGRAIGRGAEAIGNLSSQANLTAAQQALDVPYRQAQLQGSLANSNANFMEALRQQAIQNRQQLQNPALMQNLQNERLGSASTTQSTPGSLAGAIGGALGGFGSVGSGALSFANGLRNIGGGGESQAPANYGYQQPGQLVMPQGTFGQYRNS